MAYTRRDLKRQVAERKENEKRTTDKKESNNKEKKGHISSKTNKSKTVYNSVALSRNPINIF